MISFVTASVSDGAEIMAVPPYGPTSPQVLRSPSGIQLAAAPQDGETAISWLAHHRCEAGMKIP